MLFRSSWQQLTQHSHGIILVTGPTGSGKTTTLQCLWEMYGNKPYQCIGNRLWTEINDFTEDFDYPHDYDNWLINFNKK